MEWGLGRSKNTLISQMSDSSQQEAMKQEEEDEYFNGLLIPKIGSKWIQLSVSGIVQKPPVALKSKEENQQKTLVKLKFVSTRTEIHL